MKAGSSPNMCYIHASIFAYLVTTASWGGGLSSTNTNYYYFFDRTIFHECSAQNRGGAFYLKCNSFSFEKSCCSYCYCQTSINSGWGHSGTVAVSNTSDIELSSITRCAQFSGLGGHVSLDIEYGYQSFSRFNASHCESGGDVYGYGAHIVNATFNEHVNMSTSGFTVRENDNIDLELHKLVFVGNIYIGFYIDSRIYKGHNTFLFDCFFGNNKIDLAGSKIHVTRCTTTQPYFTGTTVGDGCSCNSTLDYNIVDPMANGNVCDTGVVLNNALNAYTQMKSKCIAAIQLLMWVSTII